MNMRVTIANLSKVREYILGRAHERRKNRVPKMSVERIGSGRITIPTMSHQVARVNQVVQVTVLTVPVIALFHTGVSEVVAMVRKEIPNTKMRVTVTAKVRVTIPGQVRSLLLLAVKDLLNDVHARIPRRRIKIRAAVPRITDQESLEMI
jgi:hypothetical protein